MARPHFRAGVITVVRRSDGDVMVFERRDLTGEWQLPQGGIERGESPREAAWRELGEETGLNHEHVTLVDEWDDWTVYTWPEEMQRGGRLGQAHRWFFFEPHRDNIEPTPDGDEFSSWAWMPVSDLIDAVVEFRKAPYRQVLNG